MTYLEMITSILICILITYFSSISYSIISIDEEKTNDILKANKKIKESNREKLRHIFKNKTAYVSSIKISISFLSMWLSALIVELTAMPIYRAISYRYDNISINYTIKYILILFIVVVLTYVIYIFFELIPKINSIKKKENIISFAIYDIYITYKIFHPFIKFSSQLEKRIRKSFRIDKKEEIIYNDIEVQSQIDINKDKGAINKRESDVIKSFLNVDMIEAKSIMIPIEKVDMINMKDTKEELKDSIILNGHSRIPVYDGTKENIVGIINTKQVLKLLLKKENITVKKVMKPCLVVDEEKRIDLLFNDMKAKSEHIAVVVKGGVSAVGIVTMEDIIEEIVGNIEDDYEKYYKDK